MLKSKVLGGVLLVSGTAIGAGMLALPISTSESGFVPSGVAFLICWIFMSFAALYLLEVNLWMKGEKDLLSMIQATLGKKIKWLAVILYLFLLYSLIAAYIKSSSAWLHALGISHHYLAMGLVVLVTAVVISHGTSITEKLNRYFVLGLIIAYLILISTSIPKVEVKKLTTQNWGLLSASFPLLITAFGYSVVLPSLTNYLDREVKSLRLVVILGGLIPLIIYLLWELVSLGIIPLEGDFGLKALQHHNDGTDVARALTHHVGNLWIEKSSEWFSIFAIVTSLLGASLALFHFLADGLKLNPEKKDNRIILSFITFIPPIIVLLFFPASFGRILSFAGTMVAILMGIIPALMVWWGRYHIYKDQKAEYHVMGGKLVILIVIAFFSYVVWMEVQTWILPLLF